MQQSFAGDKATAEQRDCEAIPLHETTYATSHKMASTSGYRSLDSNGQPALQAPVWKVGLCVLLPSLVVFVLVDMAWIMLVAANLFAEVLGDLLRKPPNPVSGLLAWIAIVTGVYYFAARHATSAKTAAIQGLLMGASLYGTYEFTNHSIIGTWTWSLAFGDFAWGSFACACAAVVQHKLLALCAAK